MIADDVLARHTKNEFGNCVGCLKSPWAWREDGCDAVVMARAVKRLREALEDLMDEQNGPPLITRTESWNTAMAKARAALAAEGEKA